MSLMNYLGAVASAAMEAAATAANQQGASNVSGTASNAASSRTDGPVTAVVSTTPNMGGDSSTGARASVTVPQGLSGFPNVVPITIHHSSGPSGQQFAYAVQAISNGSMRLAHPHVSTGGTQRTFTLPAGMTLAAGQVPAHFSLATGNSSQPTVEIRLPHPPPTLSSQIPAGSHLVDKQQRPGVFQMNTTTFRPSIPVTTITPQQPGRPMEHQEIRRELGPELRLKSSPPAIPNLNTTRPSVLMGPRSNIPHDYMPRADPAVALQDHNYTLPTRLPMTPPSPQPTFAQVAHHHHHHHHHHKEPVAPPPPVQMQTLPITHLRPPSPPSNKIHMSHPPPPPVALHPKPPPPSLYARGATASPPVSASEVVAKGRRPHSESPVTVPGGRRRRKTFEKNKDECDIVPGRKPGVPGRKRARKQAELLQSALNNTIPPYPAANIPDQDQTRNPVSFQEEPSIGNIAGTEPTKRRLKKGKQHDMLHQLPQQYGRKIKDKEMVTTTITTTTTTQQEEENDKSKRYDRINTNLSRMQDPRKSWDAAKSSTGEPTSPTIPPSPTTLTSESRWGSTATTAPPPVWTKQSPPPPSVNNAVLKEMDSLLTLPPSNMNSNNTTINSTAEDVNSEGITRCICDYLHDDGFMICCDNCCVWQHVDCMGIDRNDIPEAYLCELCNPRWVSKPRARAIQTRKKEMMDLGVVEDDSTVGDSDGEKSRSGTSPGESSLGAAAGEPLSSPGKSSGKLKRRGRPSLSNGQPFSDSDSEVHSSSTIHSPTAKRSRKYSGKRGQNLSTALDFDSPSKIGARKRRSSERGPKKYLLERRPVEPPKTRRSYTRRNTINSPLSSPSGDDSVKGIEEHKENSQSESIHLDENGKDSDERGSVEFKQDDGKGDSNGTTVTGESRRKRKQIFKDIPNGDLSPPHIIPSTSPSSLSSERQAAKSRSPSFDKTPSTGPANSLSNNNIPSAASSPDPSLGSSTPIGALHINVNLGFNAYSCPYSTSPYLDKYEEAENAVCSYSPELRAKLLKNHGGMLGSSSVPDFTPLPDDGSKRWKLGVTSLEGGKKLKTLLAAVRVEPGQAIIEFIGKFLMHTGFIPTNKKANSSNNPNMISPEPFVFFHQVPKNGMCICIDSRKYGNDARFVRRSCAPNAEIRHVVGKGTIHAYVVATSVIDVDDEVTIPHEFKSVTCNTMNSVVQKYHVLPPPLPCACSDLDTCKAVIHDPSAVNDAVVHKKNGALFSPTAAAPQETRERKRRMSSRRTSLIIDKDHPIDPPARSPTIVVSPQQQNPPTTEQEVATKTTTTLPSASSPPVEEPQESVSPTPPPPKDRSDGRTTRARTVAIAAAEEPPPPIPVTSKRKSDATPSSVPATTSSSSTSSSSSSTSRQRNRSGADVSVPAVPVTGASNTEQHSSSSTTESHKMTREERKLQSVLKIIEKMESNQKKKESRQNQKKDKTGKEKKSDDRETDQDEDSQSNVSTSLAPIRFAPMNNKKKGRKRGRSASKSGSTNSNKPQMISHRNSGSIADLRSTSTESDFNSADEAARAGMSPLQENLGPNFRLPKKKEMMSEWRIGSGSHASPSLPSQYMRKSNSNSITTSGTTTPPVQPSTSASNNFLVLPVAVANGNMDNASAKKRWLRQAISEETDPLAVPSPNSRPSSPVGVECLAPLKKRRLARASMSSEVSNTPPSTPNNADAGCTEMDAEAADEAEQNEHVSSRTELEEDEEEVGESNERPSRKWSCSEVSSAEEDMDDMDETRDKEDQEEDNLEKCEEDHDNSSNEKQENSKESTSPNHHSTTPRRSRWDQVDAPEPVVNNSNSNSPVKSTSDAIVLDYVRNPEHYAKLTGVSSFEPEKCTITEKEQQQPLVMVASRQHEPGENESDSISSSSADACGKNLVSERESSGEAAVRKNRESVESSLKTPTQVKKKLSMEEYFKRKKEGHSTDDTRSSSSSSALSNSTTSTALNSMTNSDSNSSDNVVLSAKEGSSPKSDDDPSTRGTLQFSSTPTLAERKREELGKRLSKSFGIRLPDVETVPGVEKQPTPTHTSPRELMAVDKPQQQQQQQKLNGDIIIPPSASYVRSSNPPPPPPLTQQMKGHRMSVPTAAALKQSGMPPLPPHQQQQHAVISTPNGSATKNTTSNAPNGYVSSAQTYRHYRAPNGPSSTYSRTQSGSSSSQSQGPIIGGVPVGNLIPPPPPPTASQGTGGPAFAKRFYNKRFFPS